MRSFDLSASLSNLRRHFLRFTKASEAATAVTFAISALPLFFLVGGTLDVMTASRVKQSLQGAADAAVLNALSLSKLSSKDVERDLRPLIDANLSASDQKTLKNVDLRVDRQWEKNMVTSTVSIEAEVETTVLAAFGLETLAVGAHALAKSSIDKYLDLYVVLDNSDSMGLASTPEGRAKLITVSGAEKKARRIGFSGDGCQFACHRSLFSTDKTTVLEIARKNNVEIRFDVAKAGVRDLLDLAEDSSGEIVSTRFSISSFNNTITTLVDPTTNVSRIRTALDGIDLGSHTGTASINANTLPDASFKPFAAYVNAKSNSQLLDGRTVTYDRVVFLVTDGVRSTVMAGNTSMPFDARWCNYLKAGGTKLAILYTTYLADYDNSQFKTTIAPFYENIRPKLQACASPGLFAEGDDPEQIRAAFKSLFEAAKFSTYIAG